METYIPVAVAPRSHAPANESVTVVFENVIRRFVEISTVAIFIVFFIFDEVLLRFLQDKNVRQSELKNARAKKNLRLRND